MTIEMRVGVGSCCAIDPEFLAPANNRQNIVAVNALAKHDKCGGE